MPEKREWAVRWVAFECPGCDQEVRQSNVGINHELICARCAVWGVAGHRALRRLQLDIDPPHSLRRPVGNEERTNG